MSSEKIYCIGDSHVHFFSGWNHVGPEYPKKYYGRLPYFKTYRVGAVLAYNLCKMETSTQGREKLFKILTSEIPRGAKILLCFGEIDCRAHLLKQADFKKNSSSELVKECIDRYVSVIEEITKIGFEVIVWNVTPSSLDDIQDNSYPSYGSCLERNNVSRLFNDYLRERCEKNQIKFISIFDKLIDENGLSKKEYYMDAIHLSQKAMPLALEEFKKQIPNYSFNVGKFTFLLESIISMVQNIKIRILKNSSRILKKLIKSDRSQDQLLS
jgi:hypothetical protein